MLGVRVEHDLAALLDAVRRVWASAFNAHAAAYGGGGGVRMAVVIQEMVEPRASGVAFSIDPVSGARDTALVCAVYGLGEGLVSGALDADTYRVHFGRARPTVTATLARKTQATRLELRRRAPRAGCGAAPDGGRAARRGGGPRGGGHPAPRRGLRRARRTSNGRGSAPPGRWCCCRRGPSPPCRSTRRRKRRRGPEPEFHARGGARRAPGVGQQQHRRELRGVTTPLTFSFALEVYESVYRQFCRLMGTPEGRIESHATVFANLLGLVRGRVYYNLLNWYRTLALLPGSAGTAPSWSG